MAQDFVLDVNTIHFIYKMAVRAAEATSHAVSRANSYYNIVPFGASTRAESIPVPSLGQQPITYHPEDITIVGGSALMIYGQQFAAFKQRRPTIFRTFPEEIRRETRDVDMVWWPRLTFPTKITHLFTAMSPAIVEFVEHYVQKLKEESQKLPKQMIPGMTDILVYSKFIRLAGVHMVHIDFLFGERLVKAVDLAIHDNGNSQRLTWQGESITQLLPMELDPMYCTADPKKARMTTTFRGTKPAVPHLYTLFHQQIFLYKQLASVVPPQEEKRQAVYRRIQYMYRIIAAYHSKHDAENIKNMQRVFGLSIKDEYMTDLLHEMDRILTIHGVSLNRTNANNLLHPSNSSNQINVNHADNQEIHAIEHAVQEKMADLSNRQKGEMLQQFLPSSVSTAAAYAHPQEQSVDEMKYAMENVQEENSNEMKAFLARVRNYLSTEQRENNQPKEGGRRKARKTRKARSKRRLAKSARRSRPSSR